MVRGDQVVTPPWTQRRLGKKGRKICVGTSVDARVAAEQCRSLEHRDSFLPENCGRTMMCTVKLCNLQSPASNRLDLHHMDATYHLSCLRPSRALGRTLDKLTSCQEKQFD